MATKKIWLPQDIYPIQGTLRYPRPPIWRRRLVAAGLTLAAWPDGRQVARGWDDSPRQACRLGQRRFAKPDPNDRRMGRAPLGNARPTHRYRVLGQVGAKALYPYDFGDRWAHALVVEKVLPPAPEVAYPLCLGARLPGPPQDCGGVPDYDHLLEAIRAPTPAEHEDRFAGVGGEFNPEAFSVEDGQRRRAPLPRWWAKTCSGGGPTAERTSASAALPKAYSDLRLMELVVERGNRVAIPANGRNQNPC